MKHYFANKLKDKSGIALLNVVLIFLVLSLLFGSLSFISINNLKASKAVGRHTAAFYAAESGFNIVAEEFMIIKKNTKLTDNQVYTKLIGLRDTYTDYSFEMNENMGSPVVVNVTFEDFNIDAGSGMMTAVIVSTGQVGDMSRTLYSTVEFNYKTSGGANAVIESVPIRHAVLVKNSIKVGNGTITSANPDDPTKYPKIATLSTDTNSIVLDSGFNFPNGKIELTNPASTCTNNIAVSSAFRCLVNETILVPEVRAVTTPEVRVNFPNIDFGPIRSRAATMVQNANNYTYVSSVSDMLTGNTFKDGNYLIEHLDFSRLKKNSAFTVNANEDVFIVTNKLTLGTVDILGEGTLTIFVNQGDDNFSPSSNGTDFGRLTNEEKLTIYVDTMTGVGNNTYHVSFPNNSKTKAYLMFESARVRFGQNSKINGALYTGATNGGVHAVTLGNRAHLSEGNGRALLVATNGTVYMENNSSLNGAVIAYDFEQSNGGQSVIRFDSGIYQTIPVDITTPDLSDTSNPQGRRLRITGVIER